MLIAFIRRGSFVIACLSIGFWLVAALSSVFRGGEGSFTCGLAWGEAWLADFVVVPRGDILLLYFPDNLSTHRGPYCRFAQPGASGRMMEPSFIPRSYTSNGVRCAQLHLGLPIGAFGLVWLGLWWTPRLRRARRRRRGLCEHCGYDLRGGTTPICSECGRPAPAVPLGPSPPVGVLSHHSVGAKGSEAINTRPLSSGRGSDGFGGDDRHAE